MSRGAVSDRVGVDAELYAAEQASDEHDQDEDNGRWRPGTLSGRATATPAEDMYRV